MVQKVLSVKLNRSVRYGFPGDGESCGRTGFKWRACPSLKHAVRYKNSCHRRDCPDHWRDWLREETINATRRIIHYHNGEQKPIRQHIMISLSEGASLPGSSISRRTEHEKVIWIAKFIGLKAGAMVGHAKRAHTVQEAHDRDDGAHYHMVAYGWVNPELVMAVNAVYGVVVRAYGRDSWSVFKRVEYMLSHCGTPYINPARTEGTKVSLHSLTYWGELCYNSKKMIEFAEEPAECYCPGCNARFPLIQWHDLRCLDEPPDLEFCNLDLKNAYGRPVFEPKAYWGEL